MSYPKYNCTECSGQTNSVSQVCKKCRDVKIRLMRINNPKKIYKIKGRSITVSSVFKSSQDIISKMINPVEQNEVKIINKEEVNIELKPLNEFDRAKMMARKYKHLNLKLKSLSRGKITSISQVNYIYYLINTAKNNINKATNKG